VDGNIGGNVSIGKTLHQPSSGTRAANVTYGALVNGPVNVPPPCCNPSNHVPVAAIVASAAAKNDDAAAGISPTVLAKSSTVQRLDLACGHYYFTEIKPDRPLTI